MAGECVRVAIVVIDGASPDIDRDLAAADLVYPSECGVWIDVVARIVVDRPDLRFIDDGLCSGGQGEMTVDEDELYDLGRDLGADIVAYYITRSTPRFSGCAEHPLDRPGFWVSDDATEWTFVHELTHILADMEHDDDTDNLMFEKTAGITNLPPDLTDKQCRRIRDHPFMRDCILQESGLLSFLRVHDVGTGFGAPGDELDAEVILRFDRPDSPALGCQLRRGRNEATHRSVLDQLREAFNNDRTVTIDYRRTGRNSGELLRVVLS